ncbi:MAG: AbrB/MazE/SpoVT family DNA-binding domain-containing protein [Ilumatobacter sp.]|nr:MAG: AbrB/MazE/SpoVT family DNA-binding domain-containing protein [Ilumatobacter sp.]
MHATMDGVGRIVIPKAVRDSLGVGADTVFEVEIDGSAIRLAPLRSSERALGESDGWPVLRAVPGSRLSDADVHALRDADQR